MTKMLEMMTTMSQQQKAMEEELVKLKRRAQALDPQLVQQAPWERLVQK